MSFPKRYLSFGLSHYSMRICGTGCNIQIAIQVFVKICKDIPVSDGDSEFMENSHSKVIFSISQTRSRFTAILICEIQFTSDTHILCDIT